MPGYTKQNLRTDIEDSATKFGYAPELEARFATPQLKLERSATSYQRLAPGFRLPFGHRHKKQEELYVVIGGGGRAKLDDEIVQLERLDALRIEPGTMRSIEAGPEGMEILAIGAPNTGPSSADDVAEMVPGWWAD